MKYGLPAEHIPAAAQYFYESGQPAESWATHPTPIARAAAFKRGYSGALQHRRELLGDDDCGNPTGALAVMRSICPIHLPASP
jgi:hypothetical protein